MGLERAIRSVTDRDSPKAGKTQANSWFSKMLDSIESKSIMRKKHMDVSYFIYPVICIWNTLEQKKNMPVHKWNTFWKIPELYQNVLLIPLALYIKPCHMRHLFSHYYTANETLDLFWGHILNLFSGMSGCLYIDQLRIIWHEHEIFLVSKESKQYSQRKIAVKYGKRSNTNANEKHDNTKNLE